MRRARGFTLVEMLVALGLGGLVVAGALQMHAAFNTQARRQEEVREVQQTLRLAIQVMARAIRAAGSGTVGGKLALAAGCVPTPTFYGFQFSNRYAFPQTAYDSTGGDDDTDSDWIKVVSAGQGANDRALATDLTGTKLTLHTASGTLTGWSVGDLFAVVGNPPTPNDGKLLARVCVREVTSLSGNDVLFNAPGPAYAGCANPVTDDGCISGAMAGARPSAVVRRFGGASETVFRLVIPPAPDSPKLAMQQGAPGKTTAAGPWLPIADNVEDLQVALLMADGRVCNDVDDPARCDPSAAAAVRITLVGRSPVRVSGLNLGKIGGYEDRKLEDANDGYVRRAVTEEIELRN